MSFSPSKFSFIHVCFFATLLFSLLNIRGISILSIDIDVIINSFFVFANTAI